MKHLTLFILSFLLTGRYLSAAASTDSIIVKRTADFEVTGAGESAQWNAAVWNVIAPRKEGRNKLETKFKTLYSDKGIYFLFHNEDRFLTALRTSDYDSLWLDDVNEVFLWPDTAQSIYFEYEISPLNYELPILIPNIHGKFLGWRPWLYSGKRKIEHATNVTGGKKQNGSKITAWTSEFFIPYDLLTPLSNVPAKSGTVWRANMYRVDYDNNTSATWWWQKVDGSFHQFEKFGKLVFE